ncbi:MAG TPA: phosphoglucosamine mutase, partial [Kofleriaceae bacterium]
MTRTLFGTDGMRGVANVEPMTGATVMRLGMAIAARLRQPGRHTRIAIGKDTRLSGYMFESALAAGIVSMGADVWLTGPLPTPGIAFITSSMRCDAGVVISASHNPFADNGIKVFARDGYKLPDAVETEIEQLMRSPDLDAQRAAPADVGYNRKLEDSRGRYVVYCKATFPAEVALDGLRIVVDGAHGAAYRVAPAVFEELGATVIAIHTNPNGKNINARAGALYPEAMCEAVRLHDAHLGVALDGDGDRCVLCDEHGNVIDGDAVMALCATRMLAAGTLAKKTLVTTVMSNIGLERAMKDRGGILVRTQVGDRYVVEEMRRAGYNFGGEQSGHLVFLDHATTGDGIVAALRVLAIMVSEGKPLSELASVMTRMPQVLVNLAVERKVPLDQ